MKTKKWQREKNENKLNKKRQKKDKLDKRMKLKINYKIRGNNIKYFNENRVKKKYILKNEN